MKIGDKLKIKDSLSIDEKWSGKEVTVTKFDAEQNIFEITNGKDYVNILGSDIDKYFEYTPKHAKEIKVEHRSDYELHKKGLIVEDEPKHTKESEVHHPSHYRLHKHECIEEMIAVFGIEDTKTFCKLNVWKYRYRHTGKNGEKDLHKADEYMDILMDLEKR